MDVRGRSTGLRNAVRGRLSVDTRSLAAFRAALAIVLLIDTLSRASELRTFYTDQGVLPRGTLAQLFPRLSRLSLHFLHGGGVWQALLFAVAFVSAVALLVGFRSRTAALVTLLLTVSLHARNPFLVNGGDTMFIVLLVFASVLPIGARWSLDAARHPEPPRTVTSVPAAAPLLFLVVIYASNAVLRYRGELWMSGDAVRHVFGLETITVLLGPYLAELPILLEVINWVWVAMLTSSVLLVVLTGWLRAAFAASFVVAHVAMGLTLRLGVFPLVVISALVLFFPPVFWDKVERRIYEDVSRCLPDRSVTERRPVPRSVRRLGGRIGSVVALLVLFVVVSWQAAALGYVGVPTDGDGGLDPEEYAWTMYSPTPQQTYGWYALSAQTSSDERVGVLEGIPSDKEPPPNLAEAYPTTLWYRYMNDLHQGSDVRQRALAEYLCDAAAESRDDNVASVRVEYFEREVVVGAPDKEDSAVVLEHDCAA